MISSTLAEKVSAKAEKIYLMKTDYDIEKCPKAIVDAILEPLSKLYSEK
jgi:hypothetical protein